MPKADRKKIYENLFEEGVLIAEKNFTQALHPDIKVRNLYVVKSLKVSNILLTIYIFNL